MKQFAEEVFKTYDIRGIADEQITEEFARALGNAYVQRYKPGRLLAGMDGRHSSPKLLKALIRGIREAGCDVVDAGLLSTPQIKWIIAEHGYEGGIMVSASHNPPKYNGFKVFEAGGLPIGKPDGLHELKNYMYEQVTAEEGSLEKHDYLEEYTDFLHSILAESEKEVFIDPSGGVCGPELHSLMEKGDYAFTLYNDKVDPEFRLHAPNPLDPEAMKPAIEYCKEHSCIGAVIDADADRLVVVDEKGDVVPSDFLGALYCKYYLEEGEGAAASVRDSRAVRDETHAKNGTFVMSPVGHAILHRAMVKDDLHIGVEKSGHLYFREAHHSDGALHALLFLLKKLDGTLREAITPYREKYFASPEINFGVSDRTAVIEAVKEHYGTKTELELMDGVLAEGEDWWVSIRPSNTEPVVRLTFETTDKNKYEALETEARKVIEPFLEGEQPSH